MNDLIKQAARSAGARLAAEYGASVSPQVERALSRRHDSSPPQYVDPVAIGSLIVSAATLAWTIYRDLKSRAPRPSRDVVARTLRVQVGDPAGLEPSQRDRVIEVVVDETLRAATDADE